MADPRKPLASYTASPEGSYLNIPDQNSGVEIKAQPSLAEKIGKYLYKTAFDPSNPIDPTMGLETAPIGLVKTEITPILEKLADPNTLRKVFVDKIADAQRGLPEAAMLKVQHAYSGGVLNPVVEHVGDLTHRMAENPTWDTAGYEFVKDKVDKTLRWLNSGYGFEKEMNQNIKNNAAYKGIDEIAFRKKIDDALKNYADQHELIPTLNKVQSLAQQAAVSLGRQDFNNARLMLSGLQTRLDKGPEAWTNMAHQVDPEMLKEVISSMKRRGGR